MIDFLGFTFYVWVIGFLITWTALIPLFGRWSLKAAALWFCFWFDVIQGVDGDRFWSTILICIGFICVGAIAGMLWAYLPLTLLF